VEECFLDAEEVEGSIPSAPTMKRILYSIEDLQKDALPSIEYIPILMAERISAEKKRPSFRIE
jgi:hypothetical protein